LDFGFVAEAPGRFVEVAFVAGAGFKSGSRKIIVLRSVARTAPIHIRFYANSEELRSFEALVQSTVASFART